MVSELEIFTSKEKGAWLQASSWGGDARKQGSEKMKAQDCEEKT